MLRPGAGGSPRQRRQQFFSVDDTAAAAALALAEADAGWDAYLGVQPRSRHGGKTDDVACITAIWADLDVGPNKPFATIEDARAQVNSLAAVGFAPTLVVESGTGLHNYFVLCEPEPPSKFNRAVDLTQRLGKLLRGDAIADLPRVLRVPATLNWKDRSQPRPVRLAAHRVGTRFTLDDLDDILPVFPTGRGSGPSPAKASLPTTLAPRLARVIEATGWRVRCKPSRRGGIDAIVLLDPCPACLADPVAAGNAKAGTAHISPIIGALRCKRSVKCPAGSGRSGVDSRWGGPVGIPLETWAAQLAPAAYPSLFTRPVRRTLSPEYLAPDLETGECRLREMIKDAIEWTSEQPGRIGLIAASPGLGKTRAALLEIAEASGKGTILAPSHHALDEREEEATALGIGERRRYRGVLAVVDADGKPVCKFRDSLAPWAAAGYAIRSRVCTGCPLRLDYDGHGQRCAAYEGPRGSGIRLAVHAHARWLASTGEIESPLIVDELPSLIELLRVPLDAITASRAASGPEAKWCWARTDITRILQAAGGLLAKDYAASKDRYARRIGGPELLRLLTGAAAEVAGEDRFNKDNSVGTAHLAEARRALVVAHAAEQTPPPPSGYEMRLAGYRQDQILPAYLDDILLGLAGEGLRETPNGTVACMVVDGPHSRPRVSLELRRLGPARWHDKDGKLLSPVVLDASAAYVERAIRAALPEHEIRVFRVAVAEPAHINRRHIVTAEFTKRSLFHRAEAGDIPLSKRGQDAVVRMLRDLHRLVPESIGDRAAVGIVTHKPLADILNDCMAVIDGKDTDGSAHRRVVSARGERALDELRCLRDQYVVGRLDALYYGGQAGSNDLQDVDLLLLVGDPWPDIGAVREDARLLGISGEEYAQGLLDSEADQAIGRARPIRRTPDRALSIAYYGRQSPTWGQVTIEPAPAGGPLPSPAAKAAEGLAAALAQRWGASSPALLRLIATRWDILAAVEQRSATAINNTCSSSSYAPLLLPHNAVVAAAALAPTALRDAFRRALGHLPEASVQPPRGVRARIWRMRETRPGAAVALVAALSDVLDPSRSDAENACAVAAG